MNNEEKGKDLKKYRKGFSIDNSFNLNIHISNGVNIIGVFAGYLLMNRILSHYKKKKHNEESNAKNE